MRLSSRRSANNGELCQVQNPLCKSISPPIPCSTPLRSTRREKIAISGVSCTIRIHAVLYRLLEVIDSART